MEIHHRTIDQKKGALFSSNPACFVLMNWTDEANEENYYRFKTVQNGEYNDGIDLLDDLLINGVSTQYPLFSLRVEDNDTIGLELIEIDRASYDYFRVLGGIASGADAQSAAPERNLSGDALGFFTGYAISRQSVIIVP